MIEGLAKSAMVTLLAASAPIEAAEPSLWLQWGLAGVVVAYVLWRDHHRERRMALAIEAQQRWIRDTLVAALERNAKVMERMLAWLEAREPSTRTGARHAIPTEADDADHG